ncbi:MAG TPA: hypothetical protein VK583_08795 [Burkholderiales bacterium]|nr:hypothetical protein [Burkholderiales bacterium]
MEVYYPNSNRLGRLLILYETIAEHAEMLGALFALGVIVHVEDHESGRGKVYDMACRHNGPAFFDALQDGDEIPEYRVEWVHDGAFENPEREAKRVDSGRFGFAFIRKIIVHVPPLQMVMQPRGAAVH